MEEKILITGSGGFVGKNLKKFFEAKYGNVLHPRSFELNCVDIEAVEQYFKLNKIGNIIHCASIGGARGVKDKDSTLDNNLKMVENLLKVKNPDAKMILFGSGAMYGKQRSIKRISEEKLEEVIPYDLYGQSKLKIAKRVENLKNIVCLNIFACYGYGELETRFPTYAIKQNLKHLPIEINQNVVFDYLFIDDLCRIVEHFLFEDVKYHNIINVTPNESIELKEISKIINQISDFKSEIILKTPCNGNEYTGDNSRLLSELQNFKFTSYKEGLEKLYRYIKTC